MSIDHKRLRSDLVRFGQGDPINHSSPSRHVDQSHEGLQAPRGAGDWV